MAKTAVAKPEKEKKRVPLNKMDKWHYTLHQMNINKACYIMILPFFALFTFFTIIPVVMSLPIGLTSFNLVQMPRFIGFDNFYSLFVNDDIFLKAIRNTKFSAEELNMINEITGR